MGKMRAAIIWFCVILAVEGQALGVNDRCKAWLVESVPTDMPELRRVPGVLSSSDVLRWVSGNATESLDITAQYWQFLAQPSDVRSGEFGFSSAEMEQFGAGEGRSVYESLKSTVDRGISVRIAQHSGFFPDFVTESTALAAGRPNVQNRTLLLRDWWGTGIIHSKVWIADKKHFYVGSANNDWKSLTQVKEMGIYFTDCPDIGSELTQYFENLWTLTTLNASMQTKILQDQEWQVGRKVPCWSFFLAESQRCRSPLPPYAETPGVLGYPYLEKPYFFDLDLETPGLDTYQTNSSKAYLSFSPPELSFKTHQTDEQALVQTILSVPVNGTVRINTMNWLGQSQFARPPVFWSALSQAVGKVILAKGATVKVIASDWDHNIRGQIEYLQSLLHVNVLCKSSTFNKCVGKVEVKLLQVPGYNSTGPALKNGNATGAKYPDFTRVTHGKFAVSDVRAHIGTSNLIWDYYYATAGVSVGTYDKNLISQLQDVFEADWESPYAVYLPEGPGDTNLSV